MTSLYVDRKNADLRLDGEAIAIYESGERVGTVPLAPLERVFLYGGMTVQTSLLGRLGERGIGVVMISGRKQESTLMMARPHNDAARRIGQYRLSLSHDFSMTLSRLIIAGKFESQRLLLQKMDSMYHTIEIRRALEDVLEALRRVGTHKDKDTLRGLEGSVARSYFAAIGSILPDSLNFHGRNRRPPRDPYNALISLSYTILHGVAVNAVYAAGLDPYIGFYHELDFGRESLACDLMEPLRPLVDELCIRAFQTRVLRPEDFSTSDAGCFLGKAGRVRFYPEVEKYRDSFRKKLDGTIRALKEAIAERSSDVMTEGVRKCRTGRQGNV